jgi:6,7-dimethyl-8-ribityllumazine synthase
MPHVFEGDLNGHGLRIGIAVSRFSKVKKDGKPIGQVLLDGCLERLRDAGVSDDDIYVSWVPGAFELALAAKALANHAFDVEETDDDEEETHTGSETSGELAATGGQEFSPDYGKYEEENLRRVTGNGNGHHDDDDDAETEITIEGTIVEHEHLDAVIVLGCVIRGETPHFEYICNESARGASIVGLETGVPVIFGVLTCDSGEQALARVGGAAGHAGIESAEAALETATLHLHLRAWESKH